MTDVLNIHVDTAERRIKRDRIVAIADGRHWDILKSNAFVDGITRTGMLMPLPLTPEWATTTSGLYARLKKADYTFDTPPFEAIGTPPPYPPGVPADASKWVEHHWPYQGNVYLQSQGVNDRALTNAVYDRNKGFYLSWFSYNAGQSSLVQMECGWLSDTAFIGLRIWTNGKCEIYKNGLQVGEGNIFERKVTTQTVYGRQRFTQHTNKASKGDARQLAQQVVDLFLIPCRRRDILLLSNQGGGFRFTFEDLDENDPDNEITPNGRFFWRVPKGQATVLMAPLNFLTSGNLISTIRTSRLAPDAGEVPDFAAYADQPGFGSGGWSTSLLEADLSGPFVPDGSKNQYRVQVALTGDGTTSPWIYGGSAIFPAQTALTDAENTTEVSDYLLSANLSVPENPADVTMKFTFKAPIDMEDTGTEGIRTVSNRPIECKIGSIAFLTGRTGTPSQVLAINDLASRLMFEARDRCEAMEEYRMKDSDPVDGMELADAMTRFVRAPGYDAADVDIPSFGFPLPTVGQASEGEYALQPQVGDKALDWFVKLWTLFAQHTQWGWVPTATGPKFQVRELDWLNAQSPQLTLYGSVDEAVDIGGIDFEFAPYWLYRTAAPERIKCEANDIWITGRDPRTGLPFQTHYADKLSQDPTLAPSDRPGNWVGEPLEYGWGHPAITTLEAANWTAATIARRLTVPRDIYPIDSFFLIRPDGAPIWRGDKITLYGIGDVRITTFAGDFGCEYSGATPQQDRIWRPFHYTGELVP